MNAVKRAIKPGIRRSSSSMSSTDVTSRPSSNKVATSCCCWRCRLDRSTADPGSHDIKHLPAAIIHRGVRHLSDTFLTPRGTTPENSVPGRHRLEARLGTADRRRPRHRERGNGARARYEGRPGRRRHPRRWPARQAARAAPIHPLEQTAPGTGSRRGPDPGKAGSTVLDLLGKVRDYVYPIGRLDFDSGRACCC